jgi:hypothetical protein
MANAPAPTAHEDRWILPLRGLSVTQINIDFRLTLVLESGWEVSLEGPAQLSTGPLHLGSALPLLPERQEVAPALALFGTSVLSSVAFRSGALRMVFDTGAHLNCAADPSFEAWQATGPHGWRFVSAPGGDLGVWSAGKQ